jgi:hypothetical protein
MNSFRVLIGLILLSFSLSATAVDGSAGGGGSAYNFRQKSEQKEKSRWTLQEWLAQKERNHLMDLWLAMYSPSPYEYFVKGSYNTLKTTYTPAAVAEDSHQSYAGGIGAYATLIGLEGDYENNSQEKYNDLIGSLNLRILGNAVQGTHLILRYGLRTRSGTDTSGQAFRVGNQFAGADLNLYLNHHFGLQGLYHQYLPSDDATLGTVTGTRTEGGLFIDFDMLRVFGAWFSDTQKNELAGATSTIQRTGIQTGVKFFF